MNSRINLPQFFLFLNKFSIIPLAFSLIISLNLNKLSNSFIETLIAPIINRLFNNSNIKLKDREITIFGIKFEYGQFLVNFIQFMFTLIILFLLYILYENILNKEIDTQPKMLINPQLQ
jgi:large-conductance mechanosensitive channel